MDDAANIGLCCKKCAAPLATIEHLAFYFQYNQGVHLIVAPERCASFLDLDTVIIRDQSDVKRVKFSPQELGCTKCTENIGNVMLLSPPRTLLCFSSSAVVLVKKGTPHHGKWNTVCKFFQEIPKCDSTSVNEQTSEVLGGQVSAKPHIPIRKASLDDLRMVSWKDLSSSKPRSYQVECFTAASVQNTILYLPTGAGKTLIAAMLISFMHQLNPSKTIFFIVDRVPLAFQQGQYIVEQTGLNVLVACGIESFFLDLILLLRRNH